MSLDQPMTNLNEGDRWILLNHLQEHLVVLIDQDVFKPSEVRKTIRKVLDDEWSPKITAQQWLALAGDRLGVDTGYYTAV